MIHIDASEIRGGGQVLRSALGLSAHTNKSVHITNIRADQKRPGLLSQHLKAAKVLEQLTNAEATGLHLGSTEVMFKPHGFTPEKMDIHIGTAGSITLLAQALSIPAMHHKKTKYTIHGGTDVLWSPPIDYTRNVLAPLLSSYGQFDIELHRRGFYPSGQGSATFTFGKKNEPKPITALERGTLQYIMCMCTASQKLMDKGVCEEVERNLRVLLDSLKAPLQFRVGYSNTVDEGYSITLYAVHTLQKPRVLIGSSALGDEASSPAAVAQLAADRLTTQLQADGAIDEHLADQLIPFMALHGGEFTTTNVTPHLKSNIAVAELFTNASFTITDNHVRVMR